VAVAVVDVAGEDLIEKVLAVVLAAAAAVVVVVMGFFSRTLWAFTIVTGWAADAGGGLGTCTNSGEWGWEVMVVGEAITDTAGIPSCVTETETAKGL